MDSQFTNGYALLVAINDNAVAAWALPDVKKDIDALAKVLTHPERCAYPKENVKVLTGKDATRQKIIEGLDWLADCIKADKTGNATAVIYYSGHGWRNEETEPPTYYLIPYDMRQDAMQARALSATDFASYIGALKPKRLLVMLDCCHAAGMGIKDLKAAAPSLQSWQIPVAVLMKGEKVPALAPGAKDFAELAVGAGRAVLTSSQGDQSSWIRNDGLMSIFTYHLIEALTGHAQPEEGATNVLVSDVMSYVWRHVPQSAKKEHDAEQVPDYQVSGNFPVAVLLGGKGLAKGAKAPSPLKLPAQRAAPRVAGPAKTSSVQARDTSGIGIALGQDNKVNVQISGELPKLPRSPRKNKR